MEMGYDAVLVNTAIARAQNPVDMAKAFRYGVEAGRLSFLSGRIESSTTSRASSPTKFLY